MSLVLDPAVPSPWYQSRAVAVVGPAVPADGGTPVLDLNPAASPPQQTLQAVVTNTGAIQPNVRVQLWAQAFATAASADLYLDSVGGPTGVTLPAGAGRTVAAGGQETFGMTWTPQSSDGQISSHFENGKLHCCIQANVFAAVADKITDASGPGAHLDIANNRRHAQRNMIIQQVGSGAAMSFQMYAASPDPKLAQKVVVHIDEAPARVLEPWVFEEILQAVPAMRRSREPFEGNVVPGFEFAIGDERAPLRMADQRLADLQIAIGDASGRNLRLTLCPNESQRMWLNASLPDDELVLRVLDITQTLDGEHFGGARVVLLSLPEGLLPPQDAYARSAG